MVKEILSRLDKKLKYDFDVEAVCRKALQEVKNFRKISGRPANNSDVPLEAVWVLSGSGSYYKKLLQVKSDQVNKENPWYHSQDRLRLNYASFFIKSYEEKFSASPTLIYNGRKTQGNDLLEAIKKGALNIKRKNLLILSGGVRRTSDQVMNFRLPKKLSSKGGKKLAVLSSLAHLPRILRYMSAKSENFQGFEVVPLAISIGDKRGEKEMIKNEIKGIIESIAKGNASARPYPYKLNLF